MDDEPARLVDDDDVVVLVDNVQRDVLRNGVDGRGLFGGEFDLLVSRELVALVRHFAVHEDTPVLDGFRRGGAGQVFNCAGEAGVEPRTRHRLHLFAAGSVPSTLFPQFFSSLLL